MRTPSKRTERARHYAALRRAHGKGGVRFAPLSSLSPRQQVEQAVHRSAVRNGSFDDFWLSSRWMHDYVRHDYARYVRELIAEGKLTQLTDYVYRSRCRHYQFTAPNAAAESDATVYLTGRTPEERWEELQRERQRRRTNLDELTKTRWQQFASEPDGRFYTDLARLPAEDRARLTIDGQPTVELDIAGCFPTLIPAVLRHSKMNLPGLEAELAAYEAQGAVNVRSEIITELGGGARAKKNVKIAYSRIQCSDRTIRYPRVATGARFDCETDTVIQPTSTLTPDGRQQKLAVQALQKRFPSIVRALRRLALKSNPNPFFMFSQFEARIRQTVKRRAFAAFGYVPESIHDGFIVKARHERALKGMIGQAVGEVIADNKPADTASVPPVVKHTLESLRTHLLSLAPTKPTHTLYSYGDESLGPLLELRC